MRETFTIQLKSDVAKRKWIVRALKEMLKRGLL